MRAKDKEKEKEKTKLFDLKLDPSFPLYLSFHLPLSLSSLVFFHEKMMMLIPFSM